MAAVLMSLGSGSMYVKARVEQGYWVFRTIPGYRYVKASGGGKVLVRDEPLASVVQEALEGFASGRFSNQSEVQRWLEAHPGFPNQKAYGGIRLQKVTDMLTHPVYAGCVQAKKWNVSLREGRHEGLINYQTFERIQKRLKSGGYAPARKDIGKEFALRGFVTCAGCGTPLRSSLAKSCTGRSYPYYLRQTKGCDDYGKSIRRDDLESEFEDVLKRLRPSAQLFQVARKMFMDAFGQKRDQVKAIRAALRREITALDAKIDTILDRLTETESAVAVKAYERKAEKLERERLITKGKFEAAALPENTAAEKLELALTFLANPWIL